MKQKERNINKQAEWERLLETHIYIGDHLTRAWSKEEKNAESTPRHTIPKQASLRSSIRRRKPKVGKEILAECEVTSSDLTSWQESFDNLLSSEAGKYVFKSFLEAEIADENLKFWLECESLKNSTKLKPRKAEKMVQSIFDTYINTLSPHEVNIDYKMREDIVDHLKFNKNVSVFSEAQHQVYRLMHRDSYPRFLTSSLFADLVKEVKVRESHPQLETPPTTRSPSSGFMMCCCRRQASVREHRPAAQEPTTSQGPCVSGNAIEMKPIVGKNDERILDDDRKRQEISPEVTPHQPDNPNKHDSVVSTTKDAESQVVENCVGDNPTT